MSNLLDLYDSEVLAIEKVADWMKAQQRTPRHLDSFVRESENRFAEAGFKARVKTYSTNEDGTFAFEVEILDRLDRRAFDYDRQVHEVTNNLLELPGEGGIIKADSAQLKALANQRKAHGHGH
jgi:hypothetical protein